MAQPNPQPPAPPAPPPSPEQIMELLTQLQEKNATLEARLNSNSIAEMPGNPVYECAEPYYSADDIYYPAGAQFEDLTGALVPNASFIPLNPAAEIRVRRYLDSLPGKQRTPALDEMVKAAMSVRPRQGDDPKLVAQMQARMLSTAFEASLGIKDVANAEPAPLRPVAARKDGIPLMSNTRIGGQNPSRGGTQMAATRFRADPVPAAQRTTRVMGVVQSQPLGTEQPGVTA